MKKTRRAHLWIGLIASIFIFLESLTGLLMNEPWLIGQTQMEGMRGNFQPGQFNQGQRSQGMNGGFMQGNEQNSGQFRGQANGQNGTNGNDQFQGQRGFGGNRNLPEGFRGQGMGQGSIMSTIRGLHEGRIGNTNVKWLIDLTAVALMILTGTGIYLSIKVLSAESKRKKREAENIFE
ncbi:PepSY-associated TM helix domain-containing protein [Neobacillus drentensis]|uniref:PepSY-associated TM helix domain-containing protein n=1 Tax=Neobacillus drentensis TaxID=220684 RepID=UPI003001837E